MINIIRRIRLKSAIVLFLFLMYMPALASDADSVGTEKYNNIMNLLKIN